MKFDIPSWGYNNDIPTRNKMVAAVCDMISKSPAWQKGDSISLRFRSATVYKVFSNVGTLSGEDKSKIMLPTNACQVHEKCAAAAVKVIKANKHKISQETKSDIFDTVMAASEGIWDALTSNLKELNKNFAKGARIVERRFKTIDILYSSGKIIMQGDGKVKESIVVGEVASLLAGWGMSLLGTSLIKAGATFTLGSVAAVASVPAIGVLAATVGTAFTLMYIWFDWDKWVEDHAPEWWERIKDDTIVSYLKAVGALNKLQNLVTEWEKQMIESLEEYLYPKFVNAYADYSEAYAKATIEDGIKINDWINPFINKLLRAAGVEIFNEK